MVLVCIQTSRQDSIAVATTRCQYWGEGVDPQVKKFEQVSGDDYQMSVAAG